MLPQIDHSLVNTRFLQKTTCKLDMYRMHQLHQYAFQSHVSNISQARPFCEVTLEIKDPCGSGKSKPNSSYAIFIYCPVLKLQELKAKGTTRGCKTTILTRTVSRLLVPRSLYRGNRKMQKIRILLIL